jgi:hypothetical protein
MPVIKSTAIKIVAVIIRGVIGQRSAARAATRPLIYLDNIAID